VGAQILADVLGVTIRRVRDPIQANARGAAWIAAAGLGEIAFSDVPRLVEIDGEFEPDAAAREVYDGCYETFTQIHKRMRPVYRRINPVDHGDRGTA
jgi:xylulokinase